MNFKSNVDLDKLSKVPSGRPFEYRDVVKEDFPIEEHTEDGKIFKAEVKAGIHSGVAISNTENDVVQYKKL